MKGKLFLFVIVMLIIITGSCNSFTTKDNSIKWNSVEATNLPFMLRYPDSYDGIMALKTTTESIEGNEIMSIFGGCSIVSDRYYTGAGIENSVKFYKRLPDINGHKVVLFTYLNQDDNDSYPVFELQTFDSLNHCIDRLVVGAATCGERTWIRSFDCDRNYTITVNDNVTCIDTEEGTNEDPPISYRRMTSAFYKINSDGYFVQYYEPKEIMINTYLIDDWSDKKYSISKEQGQVKNHLREGQWKIVEKRDTKDKIYFVQGIGSYVSGVKNGKWDYYIINDDFSSLGHKEFTVIYENGNPVHLTLCK